MQRAGHGRRHVAVPRRTVGRDRSSTRRRRARRCWSWKGRRRIEIEGGPTLELKPGDLASIPAGAVTTWRVTPPFKEFWVLRATVEQEERPT